ncbi:RNA polymerase sigma factor [Amycolatopsis sp. VS8301801F10]|uniref:RNA polymerase sigma factor n=1 Tax=Amycolatopsis sp. VS8301801F10 TaxID=2652442 RepID=UPI0038FCAF3B
MTSPSECPGGEDDDHHRDAAGESTPEEAFRHQPAVLYGRAAMKSIRDTVIPAVIGYATKRLGGDRQAGEEVAATAFYELARRWQAKGALREPRRLLFQITEDRCVDQLRKKSKPPMPIDGATLARLLENTASNLLDSEFRAGLFTEDIIRKALRTLPTRQRQVLELRYGLECELDDTAALLKTTVNAVKSLQQRGLAKLRESPLLARHRTTAPEVQR